MFGRLLTALLLTFSLSAAAEVEVDDFMYNLERIERFYSNYSFKEALKCGESARFQAAKDMCTVSCEQRGIFTVCQTLCIPPDVSSDLVTQEVVNCTESSATIMSSDGDIRTITASDFEKYRRNPLRELFNQLPNWFEGVFKVTIMSARRGEHTLGWKTENERKVGAWYLEGQLAYRTNNGSEDWEDVIFTLIDDPSIPWFAQAARVRLTNDGTMWRLDEI